MSFKEVTLTLNGQNYALEKNAGSEYEAVITAPVIRSRSMPMQWSFVSQTSPARLLLIKTMTLLEVK